MDTIQDGLVTELMTSETTAPVAVIGVGCRFPGGVDGPDSYWNFLREKRCGIIEIPGSRWDLEAFYDPDPEARGKSYARRGGFLTNDVYGFDPVFFDMSPREATAMDPQQRLALQVAYEAAQDAGVTMKQLRRERTGVFLGISTTDFGLLLRQGGSGDDIFAGTGAAFSIAANRISHRFDLSGPSLAIDTACSSALVAIDQAVRHLATGTCDMALAGGVNCMLDPGPFIAFSSANMLSTTGEIYTFDERANGFVRGEGCGLVLLKRLDKAVADGDRIYGVIRQAMVNQDGYTSTLTAPSGDAQEAMLRALVERSEVDPGDVNYVEAHGTGTPVGDPIEATAIGRVFGSHARSEPVYVGSFKPNIGHLESAAGIAGFIKALLTAQRGVVLPNRNFDTPNPDIPFGALNMTVATDPVALDEDSGPFLTAVNSFGFGGTNASVVIEQWREGPRLASKPAIALIPEQTIDVPVSAQRADCLKLWANRLAESLDDGGVWAETPVEGIVDHLRTQRDDFSERASLLVKPERAALRTALLGLGADDGDAQEGHDAIVTGRASGRQLGMVFSGQGGQWWAMARRLLQEDREFRKVVDEFDEVLRSLVGWSTAEEMLRDEAESRINTAEVTQASIFATQIALYRKWKSKGLSPSVLIGHSFGEVAATYSSGIIGLETAAKIIALRGQIPTKCSKSGAMAAVGLTVDQLEPFLPAADGKVEIAAFNGPVAQTISGVEDDVVAMMAAISEVHPDVAVRRIQMDFAWHSHLLEEVETWFRTELGRVEYREGDVPVVSTVTGNVETRFDEDYWWGNLRQPVNFTKGIALAVDLGHDAFLELGPHRTLTPLVRGIAQDRNASVVAVTSLDRKQDDFETMSRAAAELFVAGVEFEKAERCAPLANAPRLPWNNQSLKELSEETNAFLYGPVVHPLLGRRDFDAQPSWTNEIALKNFKFLMDHKVGGDCLFPAVGYIEIMGAALRDHYGEGPVELRDLKLHEATSINDDDAIVFSTSLDPATSKMTISTLHRNSDEGWRLRAEAYGFRHDYALAKASHELIEPDMVKVEQSEFYRLAKRHGMQYGPKFQRIGHLHINADRTVAALTSEGDAREQGYFAFPGLLDSALQASIALAANDEDVWDPEQPLPPAAEDKTQYPMRLPVGVRKVFLAAPLTDEIVVDASEGYSESAVRLQISSAAGEPLITFEDLESRNIGTVRAGRQVQDEASEAKVYVEHFEKEAAVADKLAVREQWLVVGEGDALLDATLRELQRRGSGVEIADVSPFRDMDVEAARSCIDAFMEKSQGTGGVLFCVPEDASLGDSPTGDALLGTVASGVYQLITLARVCEQLTSESAEMPDIAIFTAGSRALETDPPVGLTGLGQSALIGLGRSMASELLHANIRLIDADSDAFGSGHAIADALCEETADREFVIRGEDRYVPRLERRSLEDVSPAKRLLDKASDETNFGITMTSAGSIENLVLREMVTPECEPDEILLEVAAVGLNFRDIMAATSILPGELEGDEAYWRNLGLEFSGTVRSVGADVTGLKPGDRVMGMGKGFLRRYAKTKAGAVMRLPDDVDLHDAASMPVAFLTAHYALSQVARLDEDETALVHLTSGGVGLAAVQVVDDIGATLLGTAGSDKKRDYLKDLGLAAVMNSRSLEFAEQVLAHTEGRGVDVVLNALSGHGIDKSLECLAPFGRMVEIGKRDLAEDKPIGLGSLYNNNSYQVIDLSTLPNEKPKLFRKLLAEVEAKVAEGKYKPLPATRFAASKTTDAMRMLFRAEHIGKVVVTFDEPALDVEVDLGKPFQLSRDAAYLVTGGLRGFGVVIADWLSERGAGTLVLANRTGEPDEEAAAAIAEMEKRGTKVIPAALDVSDMGSVETLFQQMARGEHPLRGIVHGAAVIDDGFLSQMDRDKLDRVLGPKVAGAWNMHNAAAAHGMTLDFFLNMSSIAQTVGSAGQANYTAANSVLNAFATYRSNRGSPTSAVAWGAIAGSGFVSRSESLTNYLDSAGIRPVQDVTAAAALGNLLRTRLENVGFANLDWDAIGRMNPGAMANPRIKPVLSKASGEQSRIQAELENLPRERWDALLADLIRRDVAKVLKVDPGAIQDERKLSELGLDSLSAFELKNRIEAEVEVDIPIAKFIQAPTIERLSMLVAVALERKISAAAASKANVDSDGHDGGAGEALRPLGRQTYSLEVAYRPMSSAAARADNEVFASIRLADDVSGDDLADRLARLVAHNDALRLTASVNEDGGADIALDAKPELETVEADGELGHIARSGPLWRFGLSTDGEGARILQVRAQRAAADSLSPIVVLDQLSSGKLPEAGEEPCSFSSFAAETGYPAGSPQNRAALAHWKEILHSAPEAARVPGRRRALAPVGLGRNRGSMGIVRATLPGLGGNAASLADGLMAAFARALAETYGVDSVVIDRWFTERNADQPAGLTGPFDSSFPVVLPSAGGDDAALLADVARADAGGRANRCVDTPGLEQALADWLRSRGIALRQFGFAFLDAQLSGLLSALGDPLDAVAVTPNEIQFAAAADGADMQLRLAVDLDVMSEAQAHALLEAIVSGLAGFAGEGVAVPALSGIGWNTRDWTKIEDEEPEPDELEAIENVANVERTFPATTRQLGILHQLDHPKCSPSMSLTYVIGKEFFVRPQMDVDRLRRAVETVRARHEAMSTRFFRKSDGYGAYLEKEPSELFFVEHVADDEEALKRATELAAETIDVTDPMFRIHVIRCGDEADLLVASAHHLVSDGYSLGLVVEEVVKAYIGLPLPEVEMNIDEFLRDFDHVGDPDSFARREAFMRDLFADPPPIPNIGRKAKGLKSNVELVEGEPGKDLVTIIPLEQQTRLRERAKAAGTTESAMVVAAYAKAIASLGGVDDVILDVSHAMRQNRRLENYVNCVSSGVPVRLKPYAFEGLDAAACEISRQVDNASQFGPFTDILFGGEFHDEIVRKGSYTVLFFAGDVTANKWTQDTASAPLQRIGAEGEIDMGMAKITPVQNIPREGAVIMELVLRSFVSPDGLGIAVRYDPLGYTEQDAQAVLDEAVSFLVDP